VIGRYDLDLDAALLDAGILDRPAFAATIDPAPARSVYRLDMSDSTPILTTLSEICACAAPAASAPAIARLIAVRFNAFMLSPM
jgi:hypothetical protein